MKSQHLSSFKSWVLSLKSNIGLRSRILINLAVLMGAALFLMGILGLKLMELYMVRQRVEQARSYLPIISFLLAQRGGTAEVDSIVSTFMKERGVEAFVIVDRERKVLLQRGGALMGSRLYESGFLSVVEMGEEVVETIGSSRFGIGDKLRYTGQLKYKGAIYGGMSMVIATEDVKRDIIIARRIVILYAFIYSAIFVVFGFFLLKRTVVNPIERLKESARRIAEGNLDERLTVERDDEIGSLTVSFNRMTESLVEKIEALERANRELIETQGQMLRIERMASLGRLASGVAHEIGNPLGAISGYIDILLGDADEGSEKSDILKRVSEEIGRIKETIHGLLDFARPSPVELKAVEVNSIVTKTYDLLKNSLKGIDVRLNLSENLPPVRADSRLLEQVLLNLILNAQDSMPSGGNLSIATGEEIKDRSNIFPQRRVTDPPCLDFTGERRLPSTPHPIYRWIRIVIADTGCGMGEAALKQIFAPFFSTKGHGKGTGLGLSISLGIIQAFGGDIRVKSKKGKGSTFEVLLPAVG